MIDVVDGGESSLVTDTFSIVTASGYSAAGAVTQGSVQVHQ